MSFTRAQIEAHNARVAAEASRAAKKRANPDAAEMVPAVVNIQSAEKPRMEAPLKQPRQMNKTERAFSDILESKKRKGECRSWRYEGIRLKWGGGMHYTPDFVFVHPSKPIIALIEVKGAHIFDRDLVRFKGCREEWKHEFDFEMHQYKNREWKRIH